MDSSPGQPRRAATLTSVRCSADADLLIKTLHADEKLQGCSPKLLRAASRQQLRRTGSLALGLSPTSSQLTPTADRSKWDSTHSLSLDSTVISPGVLSSPYSLADMSSMTIGPSPTARDAQPLRSPLVSRPGKLDGSEPSVVASGTYAQWASTRISVTRDPSNPVQQRLEASQETLRTLKREAARQQDMVKDNARWAAALELHQCLSALCQTTEDSADQQDMPPPRAARSSQRSRGRRLSTGHSSAVGRSSPSNSRPASPASSDSDSTGTHSWHRNSLSTPVTPIRQLRSRGGVGLPAPSLESARRPRSRSAEPQQQAAATTAAPQSTPAGTATGELLDQDAAAASKSAMSLAKSGRYLRGLYNALAAACPSYSTSAERFMSAVEDFAVRFTMREAAGYDAKASLSAAIADARYRQLRTKQLEAHGADGKFSRPPTRAEAIEFAERLYLASRQGRATPMLHPELRRPFLVAATPPATGDATASPNSLPRTPASRELSFRKRRSSGTFFTALHAEDGFGLPPSPDLRTAARAVYDAAAEEVRNTVRAVGSRIIAAYRDDLTQTLDWRLLFVALRLVAYPFALPHQHLRWLFVTFATGEVPRERELPPLRLLGLLKRQQRAPSHHPQAHASGPLHSSHTRQERSAKTAMERDVKLAFGWGLTMTAPRLARALRAREFTATTLPPLWYSAPLAAWPGQQSQLRDGYDPVTERPPGPHLYVGAASASAPQELVAFILSAMCGSGDSRSSVLATWHSALQAAACQPLDLLSYLPLNELLCPARAALLHRNWLLRQQEMFGKAEPTEARPDMSAVARLERNTTSAPLHESPLYEDGDAEDEDIAPAAGEAEVPLKHQLALSLLQELSFELKSTVSSSVTHLHAAQAQAELKSGKVLDSVAGGYSPHTRDTASAAAPVVLLDAVLHSVESSIASSVRAAGFDPEAPESKWYRADCLRWLRTSLVSLGFDSGPGAPASSTTMPQLVVADCSPSGNINLLTLDRLLVTQPMSALLQPRLDAPLHPQLPASNFEQAYSPSLVRWHVRARQLFRTAAIAERGPWADRLRIVRDAWRQWLQWLQQRRAHRSAVLRLLVRARRSKLTTALNRWKEIAVWIRSIVLVQASVKGWLARRHIIRTRAAARIQTLWRGHVSRVAAKRIRAALHQLATKLQAVARGWFARRHVRKLLQSHVRQKVRDIRALWSAEQLVLAEKAAAVIRRNWKAYRRNKLLVGVRSAAEASAAGELVRKQFERQLLLDAYLRVHEAEQQRHAEMQALQEERRAAAATIAAKHRLITLQFAKDVKLARSAQAALRAELERQLKQLDEDFSSAQLMRRDALSVAFVTWWLELLRAVPQTDQHATSLAIQYIQQRTNLAAPPWAPSQLKPWQLVKDAINTAVNTQHPKSQHNRPLDAELRRAPARRRSIAALVEERSPHRSAVVRSPEAALEDLHSSLQNSDTRRAMMNAHTRRKSLVTAEGWIGGQSPAASGLPDGAPAPGQVDRYLSAAVGGLDDKMAEADTMVAAYSATRSQVQDMTQQPRPADNAAAAAEAQVKAAAYEAAAGLQMEELYNLMPADASTTYPTVLRMLEYIEARVAQQGRTLITRSLPSFGTEVASAADTTPTLSVDQSAAVEKIAFQMTADASAATASTTEHEAAGPGSSGSASVVMNRRTIRDVPHAPSLQLSLAELAAASEAIAEIEREVAAALAEQGSRPMDLRLPSAGAHYRIRVIQQYMASVIMPPFLAELNALDHATTTLQQQARDRLTTQFESKMRRAWYASSGSGSLLATAAGVISRAWRCRAARHMARARLRARFMRVWHDSGEESGWRVLDTASKTMRAAAWLPLMASRLDVGLFDLPVFE